MGRGNHLVHLDERMIRRRRFIDIDIQGRPRHLAFFERFRQILFVHDAASGTVNDPDSLFHFGNGLTVDQSAGLVSQRDMHGNEV